MKKYGEGVNSIESGLIGAVLVPILIDEGKDQLYPVVKATSENTGKALKHATKQSSKVARKSLKEATKHSYRVVKKLKKLRLW